MGCARDITGIPGLFARPRRTTRARLVCAVLLAFALRALIPLGFMPASDGSFSLVMCPGGFPVGLLRGQSTDKGMQMPEHPGHGLMDQGYCAFTTGFSSAPPPLLLATLLLLLSCVAVIAVAVLAPGGTRLVYLPQARAPPALL